MSTGPNRIMDEFAKLVTDAAGAAQGVRREVETAFRAQAERILNSMDVVQREEFEAAREMAIKAREENVRLSARIDALEAKLAGLAEAPGSTAPAAAATDWQRCIVRGYRKVHRPKPAGRLWPARQWHRGRRLFPYRCSLLK